MKILHLIQTSGPGGAEKLLLTLTKNSKDKYLSIVGLLKNGWLLKQLQNHDVKVKIIPSGGSFDLKFIKNLVDIIKKEKIDLIHSHLLDMNFYSSIAAKIAGDKFLKLSKVPKQKIAIISNGIDLKEYEQPIDIQSKKAEIGIKNNEFIIGNVANLYPVKGQIYLLKATAKIIKEFPNTKFLFILVLLLT